MDPTELAYVSYRWHQICNPYSLPQLERTLSYTDLKPGDRAADLGSGNGFTACWMAERYGLDQVAVERYTPVADLARAAAAKPRPQGQVTVVETTAQDYLKDAGRHRMISVLGAIDLLPGLNGPSEVMSALAESIEPGGWLLWGDLFWLGEPSPKITVAFAVERFCSLTGWIAAGEAAGLTPHHVATSTHTEWEEFVWRMNSSIEDYAETAPPPIAAGLRLRAKTIRDVYLEEGREVMGFGLFLFRKPRLGSR